MVISLNEELEAALNESARRKGIRPEDLVVEVLRTRFSGLSKPEPQDDWERRLIEGACDCGVSLSNEALSRDTMYD